MPSDQPSDNNFIRIFIISLCIFFIVTLMIFCIVHFTNSKTVYNIDIDSKVVPLEDREGVTLVHFSPYNGNIINALENFKTSEIISLTNLPIHIVYDFNSNIERPITYWTNHDLSTLQFDSHALLQGYVEYKNKSNYLGVSILNSIPIGELKYIYSQTSGSYLDCYLRKFRRNIDHIEYYVVQINMKNQTSVRDIISTGYLASIFTYLSNTYPGEYIITGNFGVHGFELVFKDFFEGANNYYIIPSMNTYNNEKGSYNTDGVIVSKNLYNHITYKIKLYPGSNKDNMYIEVKMINSKDRVGVFNTTSPKMLTYLEILKNTLRASNTRILYDSALYNKEDLITQDLFESNNLNDNTIFPNIESENYEIRNNIAFTNKIDTLQLL